MKNLSLNILIIICITALMTSCNENQQDYIPEVKVNFEVDLFLPSYTDLNIVGGSYIDTTRGYKGIIIYRATESDFYAFDQACPYDPYENEALVVLEEPWGSIAVDHHCGSRFLLTDGFPIEGPAELPLKQYNASLIDGHLLRIYN